MGTVDSDGRRVSDPWRATRTSDWSTKRGGAELAEVRQCSKPRSVGLFDSAEMFQLRGNISANQNFGLPHVARLSACRPLVNQFPAKT
jgi:hypothetical protein